MQVDKVEIIFWRNMTPEFRRAMREFYEDRGGIKAFYVGPVIDDHSFSDTYTLMNNELNKLGITHREVMLEHWVED